MFPILLNIGPLTIHTYGFLIALGFLVAVNVIKRLAKHHGLDQNVILDITFWALFIGFIGARTLFIVTRFSYFMSNPAEIVQVWNGGLVFYGGPIFAVPYILYAVRKKNLPIWKVVDVLTPGLVVNHAFGRLGCLAAGCCYGKPTGTSFGVKLQSELVDAELRGIPLHPTQLYEGAALFILFFALYRLNKTKVFDGQVFLTYFIAYPIIRSIVEIFRGDLIRGFVIDNVLSTSQFISIIVFALASLMLYLRLRAVNEGAKQ